MNIDISFHKPKQHFLKVLLGFSICFICNKVQSQHNLVLNPSFEQYTICPTKMNAPPPPPWYLAVTYIPLCYANSCSPDTFRSVPNNYIKTKNFQYARTGNAYVFADYLYPGRQYFQTRLTDSLRTNRYYYAEHFVNIPNGLRLSCNNVGMLFTKTAVYVDTVAEKYGVLPANPQIVNYGNPTLGDTVNWVKVSGVFKALGGEQYLTLGNFKQDSNTILKQIQPTGSYSAGYVIDDVSVIPLDSFCLKADAGRDATITIGDSVFIGSYTNGIDTIKWFNSSGQLIDTVQPGFWVKPTSTGTSFYVLQQTVNGCYTSDTIYVNVVLPLRMMSYELRIMNERQVLNKWETMNEINVSHYNIERSINAKDFTVIGKVKAKNKSYNEYTFTDELKIKDQEPKTLYYRIVGVDNDGKLSYSQVKKLSTINYKPSTINIYPNPTKGLVHILIPSDEKAIWTITVQDVLGKVMSTTQTTALTKSMDMLVSNQRGMYFITLTNNKTGKRFVEKILVE